MDTRRKKPQLHVRAYQALERQIGLGEVSMFSRHEMLEGDIEPHIGGNLLAVVALANHPAPCHWEGDFRMRG
jgi:hypothetical protein